MAAARKIRTTATKDTGTAENRRSGTTVQRRTTRTGKPNSRGSTPLLKDYVRFSYKPKRTSAATRKSRSSTTAERAQPPVISRYNRNFSATGAGSRSGRGKGTRRRIDIVLDAPGAEMRLPSLPVIHMGWRWLSLLLVALFAFMIYQAWTLNTFQVKELQVKGLKLLTAVEVNSALGLQGQPIFVMDPRRIHQDLLSTFPELSAASVQIALPDSVVITVTERIPVLAWRQGGATSLIDANGIALPLRNEAVLTNLPVVEASANPTPPSAPVSSPASPSIEQAANETVPASVSPAQALLSQETIEAILAIARQAPPKATLLYNAQHGFGWMEKRGWEVYVGDAQDISMKLKVYGALVMQLEKNEIKPTLISVEYLHAPYYRLEH